MEGLSENILTNPKAIDLKSLLVQKSNTLNFDMKAHKISIAPMMVNLIFFNNIRRRKIIKFRI